MTRPNDLRIKGEGQSVFLVGTHDEEFAWGYIHALARAIQHGTAKHAELSTLRTVAEFWRLEHQRRRLEREMRPGLVGRIRRAGLSLRWLFTPAAREAKELIVETPGRAVKDFDKFLHNEL